MKKTFAIALLLALASASGARAQEMKSPRIAVVDMGKVTTETLLGKKIQAELKKLQADGQAEQAKKQAEFAKLQAEFEAVKKKADPIYSPEAQESARQEIIKKQRELQIFAEDSQAELNKLQLKVQERASALDKEFQEKIRPALDAAVKERGIDILFDSQAAMSRNPEYDITDTIIAKSDEVEKSSASKPAASAPAAKPAGPSPAAPKPAAKP